MEIPVEHEDPLAWGDVRDDDGQRERAQDSRPLVPSSLWLLMWKVLLFRLLLGECTSL